MKSVMFFMLAISVTFLMVGATEFAHAAEGDAMESSSSDGFKLLGAGLAFGLAAIGSGIGLAYVGSAGLAVISEKPALLSTVFIFVGMAESIAIYGIVMMFIILGQ